MAVESSPPANSKTVYNTLFFLGIVAALIAFSTMGFIAHQYVTRIELRNPPAVEKHHAVWPSLVTVI